MGTSTTKSGLPSRIWSRVPLVVRAIVSGCVVLTAGGILTGPLLFANTKFSPEVPWSVPLLAAYMWFFWQYLRGRWWPRATAEARRQGLRANPLSSRMWRWAMAAGCLGLVAVFALHLVVGRLTPLNIDIPALLRHLPSFTLLSMLLMVSVIAGIVEEAAFRGFMQGPIERRHGVFTAIAIVSIVFGAAHLTDWQPNMTAARMSFIVLASVFYGIMVHLTDSILPGLILHAAGNAIGIVWIWALSKRPPSPASYGFAAASPDPQFWVDCLIVVAFGAATVWAFRHLADVARNEQTPGDRQ